MMSFTRPEVHNVSPWPYAACTKIW